MDYKLEWLARLRAGRQLAAQEPAAPARPHGRLEHRAAGRGRLDMAVYEGKTHVSPAERAAFQAILDAGFTDVARPHTPGPGTYTYWDYTQLRFPKRQGMRIDFVLGSPAFASRVETASIDREERKGKGASDHAPVDRRPRRRLTDTTPRPPAPRTAPCAPAPRRPAPQQTGLGSRA